MAAGWTAGLTYLDFYYLSKYLTQEIFVLFCCCEGLCSIWMDQPEGKVTMVRTGQDKKTWK
jgi:hypothetical protein